MFLGVFGRMPAIEVHHWATGMVLWWLASGAAGCCWVAAAAAQAGQPMLQGCNGLWLQAVVGPAAALPVRQQACLPQHPQVEGQA